MRRSKSFRYERVLVKPKENGDSDGCCDDEFDEKIREELRKNSIFQNQAMKHNRISRSLVDIKDVLKTCENMNQGGGMSPPPFPTDEAEIRQSVRRKDTIRPVTISTDSPLTQSVKFRNESVFLMKGLEELKFNDTKIALNANDIVQITENAILIEGNKTISVRLVKGASIHKKVVQVHDTKNILYTLRFRSSKDARLFIDWDKMRNTSTNRSIMQKINRLLGKRSSRELLESKGILKNEPIFGNSISDLYKASNSTIPEFLIKIIDLIELPTNIKSTGIYRASANLATIQKIRLKIDEGNLNVLETYKNDVDVLAGTLKLFFRELKYSLVTFELFEKITATIDKHDLKQVSMLVRSLEEANYRVLSYVLSHLIKVCEHESENKMTYHNMAIAWGPSFFSLDSIPSTNLIAIQFHSTNSHKVTEYFLDNYMYIFEPVRKEDRIYSVVATLCTYIERNGRNEAIYRKSGSKKEIEEIMRLIRGFELEKLGDFSGRVHELCGALKLYIMGLEQPLISRAVYEKFVSLKGNVPDAVLKPKIMESVKLDANSKTIQLLMEHWRRIVAMNGLNSMQVVDKLTMVLVPEEDKAFKTRLDGYSALIQCLLSNEENSQEDERKTRIFSTYDNY